MFYFLLPKTQYYINDLFRIMRQHSLIVGKIQLPILVSVVIIRGVQYMNIEYNWLKPLVFGYASNFSLVYSARHHVDLSTAQALFLCAQWLALTALTPSTVGLNFTYRDGSCDEAAFVKDGIHLSTHGLNKLLSNISLSERQPSPTARPGKNRPPNRQGSPPKRTTRDTRGNGPHANGPTASAARRTESRNHTAEPAWHTVGQCRKCGETNHVTKKCRHDVAVTCFTCGQKGHKNMHHQSRR